MKFLIKICGVTSPADAEMCVAAGADAIGLNFWPRSSRFVDEKRAAEIARVIPIDVLKVGVFVNAHPLVVSETASELGLSHVQLHGNERVGDFADIETGRIIRTIRVRDERSLKEAMAWEAGYYLYEGDPAEFGGSGQPAPWGLIREGARRPFLLAGGLTPDNVEQAIAEVAPNGVDVASGVERQRATKDPELVRQFIARARAAAGQLPPPRASSGVRPSGPVSR